MAETVRGGPISLLDTPPELAFDRVTRLAARFLDVPVSHLSVIDDHRSFLKSEFGLPEEIRSARQLPLTHSFCRHVAASGEMLAVDDTRDHPLVGDNPVIADYGVLSYLGLPVRDEAERLVCVLCVLDFRTRRWSPQDITVMEDLVAMLRTELGLRAEIAVRRDAEERALLLMHELEHRVKNSLSTVQAIVSMSLRGEGHLDEIRHSLIERIAALAQTHALLLAGNWQSADIIDIVEAELRHYAAEGRVRVGGPALKIAAGDALSVGLIIHELTTNAAKYGALSPSENGTVTIAWTQTRSASERRLRLKWTESGLTAAVLSRPSGSGFGTTLLETLVVRQQNGFIKRDWRPEGLHLVAEFELSPLA